MSIGRFYAGIAALIWGPDNRYLLLKRSDEKDYGAGAWECVTGRVDQGEGFTDALHREVGEELGVEIQVQFIIGTTHFYRGEATPENELLGVVYGCFLSDPTAVMTSAEHTELRWVTAGQAEALLTPGGSSTRWLQQTIARAEQMKRLLPPGLLAYYAEQGFEIG